MALTHSTAVRNAATNAVVDLLDAGSADANGDLVFMTSGDAEVATLGLSATAFGAASSGTATANSIANDTSATGGTAALFKLQDKDNTEVLRGTVTASGAGGDIELSSTGIGAGDTVSVSSLTYTALSQ
ncbi:hypothetical protein [Mycolicibacterium sp.]|uniref:hypothetical protein n=1 Tax=Mycolicibacterium sp. TaxID=2320850 RepID=UPI00355FE44F